MSFIDCAYQHYGVRSCWAPETKTDGGGWYRQNTVLTWYGIVSCYTQYDGTRGTGHTFLQFIRDGVVHRRTYQYAMTQRASAIAAGKMVRAVMHGR